jgi:C1A family cysteine protease
MKILSVLIVVAVAATAYISVYGVAGNDLESQFTSYMTNYGKNYQTEAEYNFRLSVFQDSLRVINAHNAKGKSYTMGVNAFTDWTKEEYKRMLGYKPQMKNEDTEASLSDLPTNCKDLKYETLDWKSKGYVTPVKNQGACGSCWAFSAVGSLEGAYFKKYNELVSFSEQQLVACDKTSHGCNGGLMTNGFIHWMRDAPRTEEAYPYKPTDDTCHEDTIATEIPELEYGYRVDITQECLYEALTHGPTSVAIRAENDEFRHYSGGIIDDDGCGTDLDHGVTTVGYDADTESWLVKNSWGPTWGEEGYVRIKRTGGLGFCGINQENAQAVYDLGDWDL